MNCSKLTVFVSAAFLVACVDSTRPTAVTAVSREDSIGPRLSTSFADSSGVTTLTERPFNSKAASSTDTVGAEGWSTIEANYRPLSIVADASAPRSAPNVAAVGFPAGLAGGSARIRAMKQFPAPGVPALSLSIWMKLSANWVGPAAGKSRIADITIAGAPRVQLVAYGKGSAALTPALFLQKTAPDDRTRLLPNVVTGAPLSRGQWHRWDIRLQLNTPGHSDGQASWSLDGVKIANYNNVEFVSADEQPYFDALRWIPIWGTKYDVVQAKMWMYWDHIAVTTPADSVVSPPPPPPPSGCASPQAGWIWCDDFEADHTASYFEYESANGSFTRAAGVGVGGSTGMRAHFAAGQDDAGNLKLAFGRTPSSYFHPVDAGTANYRELYWRVYVRNQAGWTGGGGYKLTRATVFVNANWAQAMIAHLWSGETTSDRNYLVLDPASGTDAAGTVQTTQYNDFNHLRWLGLVPGKTPLFDAAHVGPWYCIEAHVRLNDAGQANGIFEYWINGALEARRADLNWLGSYSAYGLNSVMLENFWNGGSPQAQERYLDDFVVSTQPIGCAAATPAPAPAPVASVTVTLAASTLTVGQGTQATATLRDVSGTVVTGRSVTWASSNPAVATVSATGAVTTLAAGSATMTATSEGQQGSAALTVNAPAPPPPSGSTSCTHEPAGLTRVTDQPWDALPPAYPSGPNALGWYVDDIGTGTHIDRLAIVRDSTAPRSPGNVIAGKFPKGAADVGGNEPFSVVLKFPAGAHYTMLYQCLWLKHSANFTDGGNTMTKFVYFGAPGTNHFWAFAGDGPDGGKHDQFEIMLGLQPGDDNYLGYYAKPLGVWRKYEVLLLGNTPGVADGTFRVWVDDQLVIDRSVFKFFLSGYTPGFTGLSWTPVYGGGGNTPPWDMYEYIDHWYVSGKP